MELKKCARCGCFYASTGSVCCNCDTKDKQDIYNLNNFIINSPQVPSIDALSFNTGVSIKNISRYIENNDITEVE